MQPAYPAARTAAARIRDHFARRLGGPPPHAAEHVAALPATHAMETIIDAAFWASLRREEAYVPRISLAFVEPGTVKSPLNFERRLPLTPESLARLAPAVERPGVHLGVWVDEDQY